MRFLLLILILAPSIFAQNFLHVPVDPQEIVRFKQQFSFDGKEPAAFFKIVPDHRLVILGKAAVNTWDTQSARLLSSVSYDAGKNLSESLVSPDGSKLVAVDPFRFGLRKEKAPVPANVYDLTTGKLIAVLKNEKTSIRYAQWSGNGRVLITLNDFAKETEVCFWRGDTLEKNACSLVEGRLEWKKLGEDGGKFYAAVDASTKWIPGIYRFFVWDTGNGSIPVRLELKDMGWPGLSIHMSPSGKFLARTHFKSIEIGEAGKGYQKTFEAQLAKKSSSIYFGSFSPDEKYAAVKNGRNGMEFYDTRTGELKRTLSAMDYTPDIWADDGKVLLGYYCGTAKAWSAETGALLYRIKLACKEHFDISASEPWDEDRVSLHPKGKYLLTYSGKAVRIWDVTSGELLQTVVAPGREAEKRQKPEADDQVKGRTARWSADGKYLYIMAGDERSVLQFEFTGK